MTYHPLRDAKVLVYHCPDADGDRLYLAFYTDRNAPIYFPAPTHREAHNRAVAFRDRAVEHNEAAYIARVENLEKARARRKK